MATLRRFSRIEDAKAEPGHDFEKMIAANTVGVLAHPERGFIDLAALVFGWNFFRNPLIFHRAISPDLEKIGSNIIERLGTLTPLILVRVQVPQPISFGYVSSPLFRNRSHTFSPAGKWRAFHFLLIQPLAA
jgi:hypothetical protein